MKHPFIDHKEGPINVLKNGYRADTRIFLCATLIIVALATYGWSLQGFSIKQHVYLHCDEKAISGKCTNPLYNTCDEFYCKEQYLYAGYTYGEPPRMNPQEWYVIIGMIITLSIAVVINHYKYNKNYVMEEE